MTVPAYKHETRTVQDEFNRVYQEIDKHIPLVRTEAPAESADFIGQRYVFASSGGSYRLYEAVTAGYGVTDWLLFFASESAPLWIGGQYRQEFTATAGQTIFALGFSYAPGANNLLVFVSGALVPAANIVESSTTGFELSAGVPYGTLVRVFSMAGGSYRQVFAPTSSQSLFHLAFLTAISGSQNQAEFVATENQTLFNLGFTYTTGADALLVWVGSVLINASHVTETSTSSITLPTGIAAGTIVHVVSLITEQYRQTFTATAGQTLFELNFSYLTGNRELLVFVGGALVPSQYVREASATSFVLSTGVPAGTIVRVVRM